MDDAPLPLALVHGLFGSLPDASIVDAFDERHDLVPDLIGYGCRANGCGRRAAARGPRRGRVTNEPEARVAFSHRTSWRATQVTSPGTAISSSTKPSMMTTNGKAPRTTSPKRTAVGAHALDHVEVHADGGRDHAELAHQDHEHAEPHGVDTGRHDDRYGDGNRQHHHRQHVHDHAEQHVEHDQQQQQRGGPDAGARSPRPSRPARRR